MPHTPPHFPTHTKHKTEEERERYEGSGQCEEEQDNTRVPHPIRTRGSTTHTPPRHSTGPPRKQKGNTTHNTGRLAQQHPPFTHHATHHPLCHPTIHDGPTLHHDEGGAHRGYPTTRTTQTRTHPHTTHPAKNSARHDSITRQHRSGMSRAQATPPHWVG